MMNNINVDIYDLKLKVCDRANSSCEYCEKNVNLTNGQLAHIVAQNKINCEIYKDDIYSSWNLFWVCSDDCKNKLQFKDDTLYANYLMHLIKCKKLDEIVAHRKKILIYKKNIYKK